MQGWARTVAIFLATQALSLLGSSLVQYAIMWFITLETRSGTMMTLSILCGFVPTFLLSPFAGVWADRYDRKKLIVLADAGIALTTLALAIVFLSGTKAVWLLLLASAVRAAGTAIHGPAVGALIPQIVPPDRLLRINGIQSTIQSTILLVSPVLSGALLTFASIEAIFFVDVATAAVAIGVLLLALHVPPHARAQQKQETGHFEDLRLGLRYIREHRYLVSFFVYLAVLLFLIAPAAFLTPLQVTRTFGPEVWRLTAIEVVFSAGMTLGGALVAARGGLRNRMRTMLAAHVAMALCTIALGAVPWFWLYLGFMGLFGVAMPYFHAPSATMLQEHVEPEYLGRVFSVMTMVQTSLMPLGMLAFGPLADVVRIEWMLLATGAALLAHGLGVLRNRRLLEAGEPLAPAAPPAAAA